MNNQLKIMLTALLLLGTSQVVAQSSESDEDDDSHWGTGIGVGPFRLLPSLGLSLGYDSNLTYTEVEEISTWFSRLSPGLRLDTGGERNNLAFTYQGEYGNYNDSSIDNYRNHRFDGHWFYNPKVRHALGLDAYFNRGHDPRGTGSREGDLALLELEPDEFNARGVNAFYRFGAPGARGNLLVEGGMGSRDYRNNEDYTLSRDRDESFLGATLYWRLGGDTRAILSAKRGEFDYDASSLDSTEMHYMVGAEFDFSGKTTGKALIGRVDKDFDDPTRDDFGGASWRVGVQWRPRTYSVIDLTTGKDTTETNGYGDFILRRDWTLGWTHSWSERFRTMLDGGIAVDQHEGSVRDDDVTFYGLGAQYDFRDWLRFGAGWKWYERDSSVSGLNYDRNQGLLTAEITL